jgi:hypothetical protein
LIEVILNNEMKLINYLSEIDVNKSLISSILSRAFRSELGTNDPEEGNTLEFIKEKRQRETTPI